MTVTAPAKSTQRTKFWILCCEETEVTQRISKAVSEWYLPGVRSRLGHQLPLAVGDAIAHADYALFITSHIQPDQALSVTPLSITHSINAKLYSPASLLTTVHNRHGQTPQSWWLQLPTTGLTTTQTVEEALSKIKEFVRPYAFAAADSMAIHMEDHMATNTQPMTAG